MNPDLGEFRSSHRSTIDSLRKAQTRLRDLLDSSRGAEMYRDLYENAPDMFCSVDTETGLIIQCNRALEEKTGFARDEIIGRHIYEMYHADCLEEVKTARNVFKLTGEANDLEFQLRRKDGSPLDVSLSVSAVRDEEGTVVLSRSVWRDVTRRKRAEEALQASERELHRLAGKLLSAQEEERRRLARELHDDLTQRLAMLALDAARVERLLETDPAAAAGDVRKMRQQLTRLSGEATAISRQLHPSILEDLGLITALESECAALKSRAGLVVTFVPGDTVRDLPRAAALCLYRVAQEALRNVARHAGTHEARLELEFVGDHVTLRISDEGRGFDPLEVGERAGLGLASMRERIRLIGGSLDVRSRPGRGTKVEVGVPLSRLPNDA